MHSIVLGASHWHVPLYLSRIQARGQVVAVSDPDSNVLERISRDTGARPFRDWREALDVPADVAFVFGRHCDQAEMANAVLDRRMPLVIEKPGGMSGTDVLHTAAKAHAFNVPTAVPFIQRIGPVSEVLKSVGVMQYAGFRFIAGPPQRYERNGNAWMLDPAQAGGGCFMNLGIHFVDLFHMLGGEPAGDATGRFLATVHGTAVEDHAIVMLRTLSGRAAVIEVGYTYPDSPAKRHVSYWARGDRGLVSIDTTGLVRFAGVDGGSRTFTIDVDTDPLYEVFVDRVADGLSSSFSGLPHLDDLAAAMQVVDKAYQGRDSAP